MSMSPEQAKGIAQFLLPQLREEAKVTRKVLAAIPEDKGAYAPHETCMTATKLAAHIAGAQVMFLEGVVTGTFNYAAETADSIKTPSEALAYFDSKVPALLDAVENVSGEKLAEPIQFFHFNFPAVAYLSFDLRHTVHHRGQLSAYLRPMGAKVPAIYGGSADEPFEAAASGS